MFLRPRMTRTGGHAGPYVWGGVTGVTNSDNPWLTAVQENTATRLVVSGSSYDAEQRFLVNENPLSVRTALGVGLGSAGCAGPIFAPDKYGSAMWINQALSAAAGVSALGSEFGLTDGRVWTVDVEMDLTPSPAADMSIWKTSGSGANVRIDPTGVIEWFGAAAGLQTLTSDVAAAGVVGGTPWIMRVQQTVTTLQGWVSVDGGETFTASAGSLTVSPVDLSTFLIYTGSNFAGNQAQGKYRRLTVYDGGPDDVKVAEFSPGLFVGGNRADGATAVDAYGVTWTITRPAATTDMPRVMVGRSVQYISLPGVAGEYVSVPDSAANSITGDLAIKVVGTADDWSPTAQQCLISKSTFVSDQRAVLFSLLTSGALQLAISSAGTSGSITYITTTALVPASATGVGVEFNATSGATTFYTTADNGATWDVLQSFPSTLATSGIFDSSAPWEVGSANGGGSTPFAGDLRSVEIYSGDFDGTLVERIDAAEANANATTWTSSTSGATVTLNKSASAQYHATVVPPNTTIVQGDGVNDYAQDVGDDTITDFVPATGLTLVLDASAAAAVSFGWLTGDPDGGDFDGIGLRFNGTNPNVYSRLDDGTTIASLGDNANNITFGERFQFVAAHGSSDHEAFVDGATVESATNAVTAHSEPSAYMLFGIPAGSRTAFDLYGAAVLGERTSDTEAAAYATEGLTR